jgi:hypothetical protein
VQVEGAVRVTQEVFLTTCWSGRLVVVVGCILGVKELLIGMYPSYLDHLSTGVQSLKEVLCDHLVLAFVTLRVISLAALICLVLVLFLADLVVPEHFLLDIAHWTYEKHGSYLLTLGIPTRVQSHQLLLALGRVWLTLLLRSGRVQRLGQVHTTWIVRRGRLSFGGLFVVDTL